MLSWRACGNKLKITYRHAINCVSICSPNCFTSAYTSRIIIYFILRSFSRIIVIHVKLFILSQEMEFIFGETPLNGPTSSVSNGHANNEPDLSCESKRIFSSSVSHNASPVQELNKVVYFFSLFCYLGKCAVFFVLGNILV
jgi:hypothetical protein